MMELNLYQITTKLLQESFGGQKEVCGIEIGTKCGDLTRTALWALPQCQLYTIDPYEHRDGAEFEAGEMQDYHNQNHAFAETRLLIPEFGDRVVMLIMRSKDAYPWIIEKNPGKKFDFLLVDGDHSEEGIKTDLDLYYPLVKEGGFAIFHDFGQCHPLSEILQERFKDKIQVGGDFTGYVFV